MKRTIVALVVGTCFGFATANYRFNTQQIYEIGVQDGYNHQRSSTLFVANNAYQRGWEDCFKTHKMEKRSKTTRSRSVKVASK